MSMTDVWLAAHAIIASAKQKLGDEIALIVHTGPRLIRVAKNEE